MATKSYNLMRSRRSFALRTENWFSITRFKAQHKDPLTNPSSKEIEHLEFYRSSIEDSGDDSGEG